MTFATQKSYSDRASKADYVFDKYKDILKGRILDVGADRGYLKSLIGGAGDYTGIDVSGHADLVVDLERETIPFPDNHFDCVLCLDVLEHLDSVHRTFDELCRVSRKNVIISLPNSYRDYWGTLFGRMQDRAVNFKYYGLPVERPDDRHKWFFSNSDAEAFLRGRAARNNMRVAQIDSEGADGAKNFKSRAKRAALTLVSKGLSVKPTDLYYKTIWAVLEKTN